MLNFVCNASNSGSVPISAFGGGHARLRRERLYGQGHEKGRGVCMPSFVFVGISRPCPSHVLYPPTLSVVGARVRVVSAYMGRGVCREGCSLAIEHVHLWCTFPSPQLRLDLFY